MCRYLIKILLLFFLATMPVFSMCDGECFRQPVSKKTFVSLSPAMTEIMYAIGAESSLLAVSNYCTYPEGAKGKEKIGSTYSINEEKILKLKPDYILAPDSSEVFLSKFKRLNIIPLCFKYPDIQSIYNNILMLGNLTGQRSRADEVVRFSKERIDKARKKAQSEGRTNRKILYLVQARPMITIGKKSFITELIEKSGNYSATSGLDSYYPVILEEYAIKLKPDIVVLSYFTDEKEVKKFFPKTKIVKMNAEQNDIINRPGPRVYKSVEFFSSL